MAGSQPLEKSSGAFLDTRKMKEAEGVAPPPLWWLLLLEHRRLVLVPFVLDHVPESSSQNGPDDRVSMIDHGSGHSADNRTARLAVVVAVAGLIAGVMSRVVVSRLVVRGERAARGNHQSEAEDGG
jgi:hypothetical protein